MNLLELHLAAVVGGLILGSACVLQVRKVAAKGAKIKDVALRKAKRRQRETDPDVHPPKQVDRIPWQKVLISGTEA